MSPVATQATRTSIWLAIRRPAPFEVVGEGPLDLILWMDAASELILGFEVAPSKAPYAAMERSLAALVTSLQERPDAIAFENRDDAEALQTMMRMLRLKKAPFLPTFSAKVDEALQTMSAMQGGPGSGKRSRINYLSKKGVEEADVAALCRASVHLWQSAPWQRLSNDDVFEVTLEKTIRYVMPMGEFGTEFGIVICDNADGVDIVLSRGPMDEYNYLYFGYGGLGEFTSPLIKLIRERGWAIVDEETLPMVLRVKGPTRNPSPSDLRLATALAEAVAAYDVEVGGPQQFKSPLGELGLKLLEGWSK